MVDWLKRFIAGMLIALLPLAHAALPEKNDVRVLIDISGSMKQNDPQNLRRPALRMLVGLLQPGTRAGVWTFAKWSNPLVPLAEVDPDWKKKALASSERIQSPGMFTDIERVLQDAIAGWEGAPESHNRHLVLLTDGMVDVSKNAAQSDASRERILTGLLPRLQSLAAKVHTIALSDRADHELMKRLSGETGGWYQQVQQADELQRVFLKVFEQVGRPEGVPLKENRFTVDASVREATLLLFRQPGSADPVLISPSGERFSDSDLIAGVAWFRDQGYDLVTLNSPARGEWSIEADLDPDNRVMIVTDLKLETSAPPAHLAAGEPLLLGASLNNKGQPVRRKAFLRLLDVGSTAITPNGKQPLGLNDDGMNGDPEAGDGRYHVTFSGAQAQQEVTLVFSIESPTFMREKRYLLAVHEPASLVIEADGDDMAAVATLTRSVMAEGASLEVWQGQGQARLPLELKDGGYPLIDPNLPVFVRVEGKTLQGNPLSREIGPVYAEGVTPSAQTVPPEPEAEVAEAPAADTQPEQPAAVEEEPEAGADWVMPAIAFGIANLVLIGMGLGVWWLRKRRPEAAALSLDEDIAAMDADLEENQGSQGPAQAAPVQSTRGEAA